MQFRRALNHFLGRDAAAIAQPRIEARDPAITIVSIIYSTAPKTFTGDAVYVTVTNKATPTPTPVNDDDDDLATSSKKPSSTSSSSSAKSSGSSSGSSSAVSSGSSSASSSSASTIGTANQASATASNTALPTTSTSSGMSGGAKAGLAFGIILLFALIGAGIFFVLKKRKKDAEQLSHEDNEKAFFASGRNPDSLPSHATANTANSHFTAGGFGADHYNEKSGAAQLAANSRDIDSERRFSYEEVPAPRLSLRGVSQFGPMGHLNNNSDSRMSGLSGLSGASSQALPPAGAAALAAATGLGGAAALANRNRSNTATNNDPNNPFGNHAEKVESSSTKDLPLPLNPNPDAGRKSPGPQAADFPLPESTPGTPSTSKPPSPLLSKAVVASGAAAAGAAAIAAATAAAASNTPQGGPISENVYRVQLDFKPSMDDELDIAAGQLVRCLHEYDDGWALCIRMDRSKQGVVPRTCLSKHPVKPRPASPAQRAGPPRGAPPPGMRGPNSGRNSPAPYAQSGRNSPGPRSMSPAPPRALTPTGARDRSGSNAPYTQSPGMRSQSPGPNGASRLGPQQGRNRSESNTQSSGLRNAQSPTSKIPAGGSPLVSRKPVGGS